MTPERPRACQAPIEGFEDPVEKLAPLERRQPGFVLALLLEAKHLRGEVLERAFEVALDVADRVDARGARPDGAVIARMSARRP